MRGINKGIAAGCALAALLLGGTGTAASADVAAEFPYQETVGLNGNGISATLTLRQQSAADPLQVTGTGTGFRANELASTLLHADPNCDRFGLGEPGPAPARILVGTWLPVIGGNRSLVSAADLGSITDWNAVSLRSSPFSSAPGQTGAVQVICAPVG